jgi:hypothetical protein
LACFPTDVPSLPLSWHGAIHLIVAIIAFFGGAFGTMLLSLRMGQDQTMQGVKKYALPLSVFALVSLFATLGGMSLIVGIGGLVERIFIGSVLLWILVMSIYLVRKSAKG